MRVNTAPRRKNAARPAEKSSPGFLQWLRGRPCACEGRNPDCGGKMQAAHGPDKATKGMGTKCRDSACIPLSANCHALQHMKGWITFSLRYLKAPPLDLAAAYWTEWLRTPMGRNWQAKQDV